MLIKFPSSTEKCCTRPSGRVRIETIGHPHPCTSPRSCTRPSGRVRIETMCACVGAKASPRCTRPSGRVRIETGLFSGITNWIDQLHPTLGPGED